MPAGWKVMALGDVAATSSGGTPKAKTPAYYGGDIPWLKIGDLTDGDVDSSSQTITQAGLDASSAKWIEPGAVLIAMYGSIGKLGLLKIRATTNQAICALTPDPALVTPEWLFWVLRWQRPALNRMGRGGAQLNISQKDLRSWLVPVPPLDDQRRIVQALVQAMQTADILETEIKSAEATVSQLFRSALVQAFSRPGSAVPLGELCEIIRGVTYKKPQASSEPRDDRVALLRATNIQGQRGGRLDLDDLVYVPRDLVKADQVLRAGDLVVASSSGSLSVVGKGAPADAAAGSTFGAFCVALRPHDPAAAPLIAWFLASPMYRGAVSRVAAGSNINNLKPSDLASIPVPWSPETVNTTASEIDDLVLRVSAVEDELAVARKQLGQLRRAVLQAAMSSPVEPADLSVRSIAPDIKGQAADDGKMVPV